MHLSRTQRLYVLAITLTSLGCVVWTPHGRAETELSTAVRADLGREIAKAWCTQCHVVEPEGAGFAQSDVPTFDEIANRAGQSVGRVENFLIDPHPPMPNLQLSREEMRNLATYILSLARQNGN